jgi:hypothetical protein
MHKPTITRVPVRYCRIKKRPVAIAATSRLLVNNTGGAPS